jgi:tetratricopeptide (TPR) repeat protein
MGKVVKFQGATPEKFGLQRVRKKRVDLEKFGQLNLFEGGKVVRLNQLTAFEEALLQDEHDQKQAAKASYMRAIEAGDCIADAYCNLGIIESEEGNTTIALNYLTQALALNPRHYEAHYNLANLYAEAGDSSLAKFHYRIAIEIEPDFPNSYYNLGITLALNKEFAEALQLFKQYQQLTGGEPSDELQELLDHLNVL